jgi:hypothetical protein
VLYIRQENNRTIEKQCYCDGPLRGQVGTIPATYLKIDIDPQDPHANLGLMPSVPVAGALRPVDPRLLGAPGPEVHALTPVTKTRAVMVPPQNCAVVPAPDRAAL